MDIERLVNRLIKRFPRFIGVILNAGFYEDNNIPTACTDGKDVYYSTTFLESLENDKERLFVLAHEICHIAFRHVERANERDRHVWNIATDAVINELLVKDGLQSPEGLVNIEGASQYSAEEMYEKLMKEGCPYPEPENHTIWIEGPGIPGAKSAGKGEGPKAGDIIVKMGQDGKVEQMSEVDEFNKNKQIRDEQLQKELESLAQQAGSATSSVVSNVNFKDVDVIHQIPWKNHLRDTVVMNADYSYKNAYIEDNIIHPRLEDEITAEVEILLDTSGSISDLLLKCFMKECLSMLSDFKVKIGCFDTMFYGFEAVRTPKDIDEFKILGRGGTDFSLAVDSFSKNAVNKVIFTDGYCDVPKVVDNIIWIIFDNDRFKPGTTGKVISVKSKDIIKGR